MIQPKDRLDGSLATFLIKLKNGLSHYLSHKKIFFLLVHQSAHCLMPHNGKSINP